MTRNVPISEIRVGRRARIDAHRYEWAIADSRDDG